MSGEDEGWTMEVVRDGQYGQIVQEEPTEFSDRLRCGCERKSREWELAELQQEGGVRPIQPGVRGDSVQFRECQG